MASTALRVLIVEDNDLDAGLIVREIQKAGFAPEILRAKSQSEFLAGLDTAPEVILCDFNLPQFDAFSALETLKSRGINIPLLVVSGSIGEEVAVRCIQGGAADYLLKDRLGRLGIAIRQALAQQALRAKEREAQQALALSQERLEEAQRVAGIGSWVWEPATDTMWWSTGIYRLLGLPVERNAPAVSRGLEYVHPDDRPQVTHRLQALLAGVDAMELEFRFVRPTGQVLWVNSRARSTRNAEGRVLTIEGTDQDITERKLAAEALEINEARLRTTLDGMIEGCQVIDFDYRYLYVNTSAAQHGRRRKEELIGRRMFDAYPGIETTAAFAAIQHCMTTRNPQRMVSEFSFPDGTHGSFELSIQPVPEGVSVLSIETTEQRRAEVLLNAVMKSVPDAIITVTDACLIKAVNPSTERLLGYKSADLVGTKIDRLLFGPEMNFEDVELQIQRMAISGEGSALAVFIQRADGSGFPAELTVTQFELADLRYFTCVIRDVSERKRLEAQFLQAQKMEAIGQLAGGIAHDFNNLLMVINGYTELILDDVPAASPLRPGIQAISEAGNRAATLTRQLLTFSRKQNFEPTLVDLNELVTRAESMIPRLIREDVVVTMKLAPLVHPIKADPGQIDQILINLIVNSRDAMPHGGRVTIETSCIEVTTGKSVEQRPIPAGHYVRLSVSDTGSGMTEDVRSRIFEPFFTTKEVGKGTGLGLSVVHGIVEQSGGYIRVHSMLGAGSTFEILFPTLVEPHTVSPLHPLESLDFRGSETILVVEDDSNVRQLTCQILELHGYTVFAASNGRLAMERITELELEFDLLLTDVIMPEMGGQQLVATLHCAYPGLPVLYMSGYTNDSEALFGFDIPVDALISKPFSPKVLARKVREMLDVPLTWRSDQNTNQDRFRSNVLSMPFLDSVDWSTLN